jgi:peptide deformylase
VAPKLNFKNPFSTIIGFSEDMNNAGYDPEIIPVVSVNPKMISKKEGSRKLTDKCFSVNELKMG